MKLDPPSLQEPIELLGVISEGSLFCIHKARRGTKYIILKSAARMDAMSTEFLRREYELGISLTHACIISTLGFEENTPVGPAIILEYVEGQTLDKFIEKRPTSSAIDSIVDDILDGVDYLHHRGVLHNDIKPSNIIINIHGAARIIDFGLSLSDDSVYKGCVGGSQEYSAPEIINRKGSAGAVSDIYSIGKIVGRMAGRKYCKVVERCCQINPAERFKSIRELKRALLLRRHFPIAVVAILFSFFVLTLILPSKVENVVAESTQSAIKERLRIEMSHFYIPARDSMLCQSTFVAASIFKGEYLMQYVHFHDSLPADQSLACEEIFAEQSSVLDSVLLSLQ